MPIIDEIVTTLPLRRLLEFAVQHNALRPLVAQVVEQVARDAEKALGCDTRGIKLGTKDKLVSLKWVDGEVQDMSVNSIDMLLAQHVAASRLLMQSETTFGIATDKGSVRGFDLHNTAIFTPGSVGIFCCPQVLGSHRRLVVGGREAALFSHLGAMRPQRNRSRSDRRISLWISNLAILVYKFSLGFIHRSVSGPL